MLPTTYVATRTDAFASLIQASTLDGFRLAALPPARVRDVYWDTHGADLLAAGLALRVREADGAHTATLRPLAASAAARARPEPLVLAGAPAATLALPEGPLAAAVRAVTGGAPLRPLVALRQYRTPRVAFDGDRPALLVSLDVVVAEIPGAHVVSNEAEVDVTQLGRADDLRRLDPALRAFGLAPEARSKVERALLRLPRPDGAPPLLLPDERARLDALARLADPLLRRRARVVLLDARGERPEAIALETGLSVSRVRHWTARFRERRMDIFEPEPAAEPPVGPFDAPAAAPVGARARAERPREAVPEPAGPSLDTLLSDFEPGPTDTPHFGAEPDDLPGAARGDGSGPPPSAEPAPEPPALDPIEDDAPTKPPTHAPEPTAEAAAMGTAATDVAGGPQEPDAARPDPGESPATRSPLPPGEGQGEGHEPPPTPEPTAPAEPAAPEPAARAARLRLGLPGETPLVEAARRTILLQTAAFEAAAEALARTDAPADARRLLHAAQGVRFALDAFRAVLPAEATARLVAGLRPLAAALDARLDAERAAAVGSPAAPALRAAAARAARAAQAHLGGSRQRAWGDRARRLLDRLAAQSAAGLLVSDDAPPPPDDLVSAPGDVAVAARLRHVLASALWARFEAVRAFEDDARPGAPPEAVHGLAVALRALRFTLALAEAAAAEPVGPLAAHLARVEARLLAHRTALRTSALLAARGVRADDAPDDLVARAFADATGADVRDALARIAASI